jgi:hypothetical protein
METIMTGRHDEGKHGGGLDIKPEDVLTDLSDEQLKTGRKSGSLRVPPDEAAEALSQRNEGSSSPRELEDGEERGPYPPLRDQP